MTSRVFCADRPVFHQQYSRAPSGLTRTRLRSFREVPHTAALVSGHQHRKPIMEVRQASRFDRSASFCHVSPPLCHYQKPARKTVHVFGQRYDNMALLAEDMNRFAPVCRAILFDSGKGKSLEPRSLQQIKAAHPWYLAGVGFSVLMATYGRDDVGHPEAA